MKSEKNIAALHVPNERDAAKAGASGSTGAQKKPTARQVKGEAKRPKARLQVLTGLSLKKVGKSVRLLLKGSASFKVGQEQNGQELRLMIKSSGALPQVLQARPELGGVRIQDVQRGQDSIMIRIEVDEAWSYGTMTSSRGRAQMTFSPGSAR